MPTVTHAASTQQPEQPQQPQQPEQPERGIHPRSSLAGDLTGLGIQPGATLLVHSALRSLGYVPGGQVAVVQALLDAIGPAGTLVVPTQTGENSDPSGWSRPPVPADWWPVIRAETPAYDPDLTPSRGMGVLPEQVRNWPGARRSNHPTTSFAALGASAEEVVAVHDLDSQCGERSPLATLERLGAQVLLLGAGWRTTTCFHLAEYRVPGAAEAKSFSGAVRTPDGGREWATWTDLDVDDEDFEQLGANLETLGLVRTGRVGDATCRLFDLPAGVAAAATWLAANRTSTAS
jgi:aminoglycoside 3-N-acetyltransferase